jgi:hypothetical protein
VFADAQDLAARVLTGGLFLAFAYRIAADFHETGRLTGILLLASEMLVVVLTIARRPTAIVDRSLDARLVTTLSVLGPPLLVPTAAGIGIPDAATAPLSAAGLLVVVAAKLSLGRSFGLMPANRGIVCSGLYRWVRHPIYLGYLVTHLAFLAGHPTSWNAMVLLIADAALIVRAGYEERTLSADPGYCGYRERVPWRLLPGLY